MNGLRCLLRDTVVTDGEYRTIDIDSGFTMLVAMTNSTRAERRRLFLIGNGASASMASHIGADLCKNGGIPTDMFTDPSLLTAIANDLGTEHLFSLPLQQRSASGDVLIAVSSSGSSPNIIKAVEVARGKRLSVVTFSAMAEQNPLRASGDVNFFVPARTYGDAETCHAALLHYWVDLVAGDISSQIHDADKSATPQKLAA